MSTHKRCIDDVGLVHYANYAGRKETPTAAGGQRRTLWSPWCWPSRRFTEAAGGRARVTCLLCLRERSRRGGPGGLFPYVG